MKKIHFSKKIIYFTLFICVFLIANVFLFNIDYLTAQTQTMDSPISESGITIYLTQPDTSGITTPTIYGQTELRVDITGIPEETFASDLSNFIVEVYNDSTASTLVGEMNILDYYQHTRLDDSGKYVASTLWTIRVDTLDFENYNNYYLRIRAIGANGEIVLNYDASIYNVFGPININNNPQITYPNTIDSIVSGTQQRLTASLDGVANKAIFSIVSSKEVVVNTITIDHPATTPGIFTTTWERDWDTTKLSDGQYTLALSFITLAGNQTGYLDELLVSIHNSESNFSPPETCTPSWVCDDWPTECPSTGVMARICTATNCIASGDTMTEEQTCTYVDPNINTTTITNTNTSSDTTTITNTNTSPPPPTPPTINMRYPSQGDTVSGAVILKARVEGNIDQLSFLYRPRDEGKENRIGQATVSSTNDEIWQRPWNTDDVPSGEYYVLARGIVGNTYVYLSNFTPITIDHNADNTIIPDPPEDVPDDFVNDDGDLFSNTDENLLNLDPNIPNIIDSNEDVEVIIDKQVVAGGISEEQAEVLKKKYSKIVFDQPTKSGELKPKKLKVNKVDNISPKIGISNLVFSGIGPANSYVTIYIYSDPIVVTTKTDENGNFIYTLDKNLLDGEHEVYVTVTDDTGKIQEKSNPLTFFIKRAQAVTEEEYLRGDVNIDTDKSEVVNNFVLPALIMVGVLILVVGGVFVANRKKSV